MTGAGAAVAAYGLPSNLDLATMDVDVAPLLRECEHERLIGLLAHAVRDGVCLVTEEQRAEVEAAFRAWLTHALRVERVLLDATRALDAVQIDSRVLKGVALSHTAYDDCADRVFGDADLLVPATRLTAAADVLSHRFGAPRAQPELRPGFDDRFGKEAMLRTGDVELDVHRTFVEGAYGLTIDLADLFAPPYRFPLGGLELDALPQPQRLLHACYAAVLGDWPPRLMSLRDVAQLILKEQPHIIDVLTMARRWRAEAVVATAVVSAWSELALTVRPPVVQWAFNYQPTRMERLLLGAHQGPGRAFTRHVAAVFVLPSTGDRVAYVRAIAFPQGEYLRARGMTMASHLKRAWHRIAR